MSLISSRASLTNRCTVERDINADSDDGYNNPLPPSWLANIEDLPCRVWTAGHETVSDKGVLSVVIEVHLIVPLGTDVTDADRVNEVTYRGAVVQEGPLSVRAVLSRRDHLELVCAKAA